MVAEKVAGAVEIPVDFLEAEPMLAGLMSSSTEELGATDPRMEADSVPKALQAPVRKGIKRERKEGGWAWMQDYRVDLAKLDLYGLLQAMGIPVGTRSPYGDGTKFGCQCIYPEEHTDGKDGGDSWVYYEPGKIPAFHCSHSCHRDSLKLPQVLELAGPEMVARFAPEMDVEDLPKLQGGHLRRTKDGIFFFPDEDGASPIHLCGPLWVRALIRDKQNTEWGLLLGWQDPDGLEHLVPVGRKMLAGDGIELRSILLNGGCHITNSRKGREIFSDFLNQVRVKARARSVAKIGWNDDVYVLPQTTIGDTSSEVIVFQGSHRGEHFFREAGDLQDWKDRLGTRCVGNSRLVLAVASAFAPPLLKEMGLESGGINFQGLSSTGKSTTLFAAGSVWGGGDPRKGFLNSWRSTSNGLEGTALAHNDAPLLLDEMGEVDAAQAGEIAYMLANGQQKARARTDGSPRAVETWSLLFLSSGEVSLAEKMLEAGRHAKVGQEVRLVDIPADAGKGLGIFETLHGAADGAQFADEVKNASLKFYGTPSRVFLKALVDREDRYRSFLKEEMAIFLNAHCPRDADGQVKRVAQRFSLIAAAGELATHLGILPWPKGEAHHGVGVCFNAWLEGRGGKGPAEIQKGVRQVLQFIQTYGSSRFEDAWNEDSSFRPNRRAGFRRQFKDHTEYYMFAQTFKGEACAGFDSKRIAKALLEAGHLLGEGAKTSRSVKVPGHGSQRVYYFPHLPDSIEPVFDGPSDDPNTP